MICRVSVLVVGTAQRMCSWYTYQSAYIHVPAKMAGVIFDLFLVLLIFNVMKINVNYDACDVHSHCMQQTGYW